MKYEPICHRWRVIITRGRITLLLFCVRQPATRSESKSMHHVIRELRSRPWLGEVGHNEIHLIVNTGIEFLLDAAFHTIGPRRVFSERSRRSGANAALSPSRVFE